MNIEQNPNGTLSINLHKDETTILYSLLEWTMRELEDDKVTDAEITLVANLCSDLEKYINWEEDTPVSDNVIPIKLINKSYND
jgi:hypothetical protein